MNAPPTYSFSVNEEYFEGELASHDEAASIAFQEHPDATTVYTGLNQPFVPDYTYAAQAALEQLIAQADDEWGEYAEGWDVHLNKAILERITQSIEQAVEELDAPSFYTVTNVQQHWRNPGDECE